MLGPLTYGALSSSASASYAANVLALNPVGYWPLNETSGTAAVNIGSMGTAGNGAYSGATLNSAASPITGDNAPLFDGVNNYVDTTTAALSSAISFAEITLAGWFKMSAAGVWSDGSVDYFMIVRADNSNFISINKQATTNQIRLVYLAGGTSDIRSDTSLSGTTNWFHAALTASVTNDRARFYINGVQSGADLTTLGTWAGALGNAHIGSFLSGNSPLNGYASHCALWATELTAAQVVTLATAV